MLTTTLNRIREHSQCKDELANLLAGLGKTVADDEPLPFATILAINGLDDALDAASAGEYAAEVASWAAERRWDAAWGAARGSVNVVEGDALWNAAEAAERKWQEQEFLRVVTETGVSDGCY